MPGKVRKCLRDKTLHNVMKSELSETDKNCIADVFVRFEHMLDSEKHGRWKLVNRELFPVHQCPFCGYGTMPMNLNYCPHCGAKMDLKEGEAE